MKKHKEYSKQVCTFCVVLFIVTIILSLGCSIFEVNTDLFSYLIPSSGAIATAALGFYFTKAKAENLSKQKIRNVVLKLVLEDKLSEEDYYEIVEEIENIDVTIESKLNSLYEDSVNQDIEVI